MHTFRFIVICISIKALITNRCIVNLILKRYIQEILLMSLQIYL